MYIANIGFTRYFCIFSTLLFTGIECKEDEPYIITCESGPIEPELVPYGTYGLQNINETPGKLRNLQMTIQTQADFEYYLHPAGGIYPIIDFKRKTLLLVRTDEKLAFRGTQRVSIDCDKKLITWQVDAIHTEGLPQYPELRPNQFAILVPKIDGSYDYVFQPNIIE